MRKLLLFIYFFFRFNYDPMSMHFDSILDAIADIRKGRMVIVTDDADRENEGDLVMAASKITPRTVNFMAKYGRGLICAPANWVCNEWSLITAKCIRPNLPYPLMPRRA